MQLRLVFHQTAPGLVQAGLRAEARTGERERERPPQSSGQAGRQWPADFIQTQLLVRLIATQTSMHLLVWERVSTIVNRDSFVVHYLWNWHHECKITRVQRPDLTVKQVLALRFTFTIDVKAFIRASQSCIKSTYFLLRKCCLLLLLILCINQPDP